MVALLGYLRAQIHKRIPGGQLIWYDSVISTGEVAWQDKLSPENYAFFEQTDGKGGGGIHILLEYLPITEKKDVTKFFLLVIGY